MEIPSFGHPKSIRTQTFKTQAICLDLCEKLNLIAVGCDNGTLAVFELDKRDPLQYSELLSEKIHNSRIMKVRINEKEGLIYTISEDKHLKIYDLKAQGVTHELVVSKEKLAEMYVDSKHDIGHSSLGASHLLTHLWLRCIFGVIFIGYISDRGGNIIVVNLASNPPSVRQVVRTSSDGSIRGLEIDIQTKRMYCSCFEDHYVHIFRLVSPSDPEGRIEKIQSIKTSMNPRTLKWWPEKEELYIGHQSGLISVINFKLNPNGPIYSGKCHDGNVNTLQILQNDGFVISGSGDKTVKFWEPPTSWAREPGSSPVKKKSTKTGESKKKVVVDDDEDDDVIVVNPSFQSPIIKQFVNRVVKKNVPTNPAMAKEEARRVTQQGKGPVQKKIYDDDSEDEGGYEPKPKAQPVVANNPPAQQKKKYEYSSDEEVTVKKPQEPIRPTNERPTATTATPKPITATANAAIKKTQAPVQKKEEVKRVFVGDEDSDDGLGGWNK